MKLVVRRLLETAPLLVAVSAVTFFLVLSSPGSYVDFLRLNPRVSDRAIQQLETRLGLHGAWYNSWIRYVWSVIRHGYMGESWVYSRPVTSVLGEKLFNTFILSLSSTIFAWVVAIPLGIIAAVKQGRLADRIASFIAFFGLSIPAVLLALFAVYFAAVTGWFPIGGTRSNEYYKMVSTWDKMRDIIHHLILPTVVLGTGILAVYTRQARSNLLDELHADYVRTARAKGVSETSAILHHAFRNALNPLITMFGFALGDLLSGAFVVENVVGWDGLGLATIQAYGDKDLFMIVGTTMLATVMLVFGNLAADILLAWNDPRIRYE